MSLLWVEGTVHTEAVFNFLIVEVEHHHRKHIAQAELPEEGDLHKGFLLMVVEEHQCAVCGITGVYGEVHRITDDHCPKGIRPAGT